MNNAEPIESCPEWAEWLDSRHVAVQCRTCGVTYTGRYEFVEFYAAGTKSRIKMIGGVPKTCKVCARERTEARRKALPLDQFLVEVVKAHAAANYDEDGWDYVVETQSDEDVWEVIAGARTPDQAVRRMLAVCSLWDEQRQEARAY